MSIRITELDAITSLQNGDYIAVDNESTGTHKFDALNIGANIGQNIANTYSSSASYAIGQYCLYDNNLYKCTTTISTPEAWNSSHWIQVTVGEGLYEKVDKVSGKGLSTNDFTDEYKQKLGGIEAGAEVNVQANWAETNTSSDSYIQNKPGNATTETSGFMSASDKQKLNGIANGAEVNVQANWAETDSSKDDYIKNKPTIDDTLSTSSTNAVENSAIATAINNVTQLVSDEATARVNAVNGEATARENADIAINEDIGEINTTLETKANIDGSYQEMTVGSAEQLISDVTTENNKIYTFRTTGGSIDVGDRKTEQLVGGTVAWNQLVRKTKATFTQNDVTFTNNGDGSWTVAGTASASVWANFDSFSYPQGANHVLLYMFGQKSVSGQYRFLDTNRGNGNYVADGEILKPSAISSVIGVGMNITNGVTVNITVHPMFFDLTQMFGSTIADAIYAMEQTEAGTGVAWFKNYFPKSYYAYNAGSLQSVNIASGVNTGFNQWDEEWEVGAYSTTNGVKINSSTQIRCKNLVPILPNTVYCFTCKSARVSQINWYDADGNFISNTPNASSSAFVTTAPNNAHFTAFQCPTAYGTTYNNDICINIRWDGERDGEYEPYDAHTYNYDSSLQLRGIPSLDEFNNLVYDGDIYSSDGTVQRKYGIVDLGSLNWNLYTPANIFFAKLGDDQTAYDYNGIMAKYAYTQAITSENKAWANNSYIGEGYNILIRDTAYSTTSDFKTAMNGVYFVYELATPTEESADPYQNPQIINDWGTEEWVDAYDGRDFLIPPGHNTQYMINLKAKLEMSPNSPDGDGEYIVRQTDSMNEYIPFSWAGEHEDLIAGGAQQLISDIYEENSEPYLFRTSGGSIEIGDREYMDAVVGGTVAWNQLCNMTDGTETYNAIAVAKNGGLLTASGTASASGNINLASGIDIAKDHVYLLANSGQTMPISNDGYGSLQLYASNSIEIIVYENDTSNYKIGKASASGTAIMRNRVQESTVYNLKYYPQLFDLTQMFGSTIADYIYSLEQANAVAGVAWFKKLFPKPYYAYNAGELKSVSGLVSHDMTGFNQFDGVFEQGTISTVNGSDSPSTNNVRSKNYIKIIPSQTYYYRKESSSYGFYIYFYDANKNLLRYVDGNGAGGNFTAGENEHYVRFRYNSTGDVSVLKAQKVCLNLAWDNSRNGEYEPYELHSYPLDSSLTLRGIPKLDANNNLYYDGDTYESDGTVTRKYGVVTLDGSSDEVWNTQTALPNAFSYVDSSIKDGLGQASVHVLSNYLEGKTQDEMASPASPYGVAQFAWGTQLVVRIENITTLADLKTYLASNPLQVIYELATSTTETADPYTSPQIVNDFGTEEFVIDSEIAVPIPVGHNTRYTANLKAKLEMAPDSPNGDGDYIVRQSNGVNTYVPLVIEDVLPATPTTNGTYRLIATVTDGEVVLSWESNT